MNLRMIRLARIVVLATAFFGVFAPGFASAEDDPAFLRLAIGRSDINDNMEAVEFRAEYQSSRKFWIFKPFGGLMATSDASIYGYGGILVDFYFGDRWVLTPSFAAGLYEEGDGKDLGDIVEFRSSIGFAYRFNNRSRLGLSFYHLSNASLSEDNQGTEILSVGYSIPLR